MSQAADLKRVEKRAFHAFQADGLLEIFVGILFLAAWAGELLPRFGFSHRWTYPVIACGVGAFLWGKSALTRCRLGTARFGPGRRRNRVRLVAVLVSVQIVIAVAWALSVSGRMPEGSGRAVLQSLAGFVFFIVPFGAPAWFLDNPIWAVPAFLGFLNEALRGRMPELANALFTFGLCGTLLHGRGACPDGPLRARESHSRKGGLRCGMTPN